MRDPKDLAERLEASWLLIGEFFASRNWPDTELGRAASDLNADVPAMLAALRSERYVLPGQWIPVSERLPEKDDKVKVLAYGDGTECHECGLGSVWDANAEAFHSPAWIAKYKVTYWRPMIDTPAGISLPRP